MSWLMSHCHLTFSVTLWQSYVVTVWQCCVYFIIMLCSSWALSTQPVRVHCTAGNTTLHCRMIQDGMLLLQNYLCYSPWLFLCCCWQTIKSYKLLALQSGPGYTQHYLYKEISRLVILSVLELQLWIKWTPVKVRPDFQDLRVENDYRAEREREREWERFIGLIGRERYFVYF